MSWNSSTSKCRILQSSRRRSSEERPRCPALRARHSVPCVKSIAPAARNAEREVGDDLRQDFEQRFDERPRVVGVLAAAAGDGRRAARRPSHRPRRDRAGAPPSPCCAGAQRRTGTRPLAGKPTFAVTCNLKRAAFLTRSQSANARQRSCIDTVGGGIPPAAAHAARFDAHCAVSGMAARFRARQARSKSASAATSDAGNNAASDAKLALDFGGERGFQPGPKSCAIGGAQLADPLLALGHQFGDERDRRGRRRCRRARAVAATPVSAAGAASSAALAAARYRGAAPSSKRGAPPIPVASGACRASPAANASMVTTARRAG